MSNSNTLNIYQSQCDELYSEFKNQANLKTALGKPKQRVRKKDIVIFAELFREYGKKADELSNEHLTENPELKQELSKINKMLTFNMGMLGRTLTDRIR